MGQGTVQRPAFQSALDINAETIIQTQDTVVAFEEPSKGKLDRLLESNLSADCRP